MTYKRFWTAIAVGCLVGSALVAGEITGKVTFKGKAPAGARISMNADPVCKKAHSGEVFGEEVVVNKNGTLKNVLIYIKSGLAAKTYTAPANKLLFDQEGCQYKPHVLGIMVGQELDIKNSDNTLHNIHTLSKLNEPFNRAQPMKNMVVPERFQKAETFKVKCDVHPWMGAYIGVFDHPYFAVTGDDGSFTIDNVPAGQYTVEAWQEKYGTQSATLKVEASGKATLEFTYKGS
jgi:plastocyanin